MRKELMISELSLFLFWGFNTHYSPILTDVAHNKLSISE